VVSEVGIIAAAVVVGVDVAARSKFVKVLGVKFIASHLGIMIKSGW
jgi:hypothetical protein